MNKKGFTFEQMAVLILVILGLTVGIILAATQFSSSSRSISELGSAASQGAQTGVQSASQTIKCENYGGTCLADCTGKQPLNLPCSEEGTTCCK